jgi:hypothetical protein
MELYYQLENKSILSINEERQNENDYFIEANNEDALYAKFQNENIEVSEEISEIIHQIFESNNSIGESHQKVNNFKIKHWVSNRSFGELIDMYDNEEIRIPDMQRRFVWDSNKSSRLIESILMGLPIPPLFLLEIDNNIYEIVDGYQRLNTLYTFVKGYPWSGYREGKRNVAAKLSRNLESSDIAGKSFNELTTEQQRIIKRSTIPLIEFKQLDPNNFSSKYLIFERINTGSEKLSSMQIRKSLAFGIFIESLYNKAHEEKFIHLFSSRQIKKDLHVEALLRILAISDIVYNRFTPIQNGLINILNEYCETNKSNEVDDNRISFIFDAITELEAQFTSNHLFKRVNSDDEYEGLMNTSILEAIIGVIVEYKTLNKSYQINENTYKNKMKEIYEASILRDIQNPFSTSTGSIESMKRRFDICEEILQGN